MLSSAWALFAQARSFSTSVAAASDVSRWVLTEVLPSEAIDGEVRRKMRQVLQQMGALLQPLEFCTVWALHKSSAVDGVVRQTREVLDRADTVLHKCRTKWRGRLSDRTFLLSHLEPLLQELQFASTSLILALNVINASSREAPSVSPGALLRASSRVLSLRKQRITGDVWTLRGTLLTRLCTRTEAPRDSRSVSQWIVVGTDTELSLARQNDGSHRFRCDRLTVPLTRSLHFRADTSTSARKQLSDAVDTDIDSTDASVSEDAVRPVFLFHVENLEFMFESGNTKSGVLDDSVPHLSHVDLVYTVRLALFDDTCGGTATHETASDEALQLLLQETPETPLEFRPCEKREIETTLQSLVGQDEKVQVCGNRDGQGESESHQPLLNRRDRATPSQTCKYMTIPTQTPKMSLPQMSLPRRARITWTSPKHHHRRHERSVSSPPTPVSALLTLSVTATTPILTQTSLSLTTLPVHRHLQPRHRRLPTKNQNLTRSLVWFDQISPIVLMILPYSQLNVHTVV
ncbi:MAG: hypothetical protein MHM6MM_002000 [Cercozoa sp. M6MM]